MSYRDVTLHYESKSLADADGVFALLQLEFSVYPKGTYDEPGLEVDGKVWIYNDETEVDVKSLPLEERKAIDALVDKEIDRRVRDHGDEIGQDLTESAVDAAHDASEDR